MKVGHLFLGKPWQHESIVTHDGYKNRHQFVFKGQKFTLVPLSPIKTREDKLKILTSLEGKSRSEYKNNERQEVMSEKKNSIGPMVSVCENEKKERGKHKREEPKSQREKIIATM